VKYRWRPSEVSYTTMAAEREYPAGRYLLNLTAAGRQGLVLLYASGDAFIRDLADGESVVVSPASLLYWDDTVDLSLHLESPYVPGPHVRRVFWQSSRIWLRVCGPGRVIIDSASGQAEDARTADRGVFRLMAALGCSCHHDDEGGMNQHACHYCRQSSDPGRT
jgi:uncharacterized protein (AIM24 family)